MTKHRGTIGLVREAHNLKAGSSSLPGAPFLFGSLNKTYLDTKI